MIVALERQRRRPRDVVVWLEPLQSFAIVGVHDDTGVEAEALEARAARAGDHLHPFHVDAVAQPQQALAGVRAAGDAALDRSRVELGEQGLVRFHRVRGGGCMLAKERRFYSCTARPTATPART